MIIHFTPSNDMLLQYVRDTEGTRDTLILAAMDKAMTGSELVNLLTLLQRGDAATLALISATTGVISDREQVIYHVVIMPSDIPLFTDLAAKRKLRDNQ